MAAAAAEESYKEFVDQILRPTNLTTLQAKYDRILVRIFRDATNPTVPTDELEFEPSALYPFHTIGDLMTQIYIAKEQEEDFHPNHQCLLIPQEGNSDRPYVHFQYIYTDTNINLQNPFLLLKGARFDKTFVDATGASRNLKTTSRLNITLQTALFRGNADEYVLDLFLYRDLYNSFSGARPMSPGDWAGRLLVYFPGQQREFEDGIISDKDLDLMIQKSIRFTEKHSLYEKINQIVEEGNYKKIGDVDIGNFKNIRLGWKPLNYNPRLYLPFRLDELFYDMPVSRLVPYIRFYPKATSPISKVYVEDMLNTPALDKPEILIKWAQDSSLIPQEDMIMAKFLLRPSFGSTNPLYGTLFLFQDASAKVVIQPNQEERTILASDLENLGGVLDSVIASIPKLQPQLSDESAAPLTLFSVERVELEDAYTILSLELEKKDSPLTKKFLESILPYYRPFFQITESPIKEMTPFYSIRFKGVDNFLTPSREFQFIERAMQLQGNETGKSNLPAIVEYFQQEFDVPREVAQSRVAAYLTAKDNNLVVVDPEIGSITEKENPGLDIAIFGRHPRYTFHLYRMNSVANLRIIKTLISTFISSSPEFFDDSKEAEEVLAEEEEEEEALAEASVPVASSTSPAVVAAARNSELNLDLGEDFDFGALEESAVEVVASEPAAPTPSLKELAEKEAAASIPLAPMKAKKETTAKEKEEDLIDQSQLKLVPAKSYFLQRLQYYDRNLFKYSKVHPSDKDYAKMCAGNALRQPIVMTEAEYTRMKKEYEKEIAKKEVTFIEYPLAKGEKTIDKESFPGEVITTLRYGSPGKYNYYICSMYWCRLDEIVILQKDYTGTTDRKGKPKPADTCPFCKQGPVRDRDRIVKGESVLERKDAKEKSHLYVGFLKKSPHPADLFLPCCFTKDHILQVDSHDAFKVIAKPKLPLAPISVDTEEDVESEELKLEIPLTSVSAMKKIPANYVKKLESVTTSYILGAEKLPLEITLRDGPQIGVCPPPIDAYFAQESRDIVKQDHTVWKIITENVTGRPNASGFFRLAVENRTAFVKDAFLSAVAPFYGLNSADELKRNIQQIVSPSVFLSLNYGNFLFDFYDPNDPPPNFKELRLFAVRELMLASGVGVQQESLKRCYKAYHAFSLALIGSEKRKEYRQFAPLFSHPNLISTSSGIPHSRGIVFIVLEVRGKEVTVRCPPYGLSESMAERCDIGFLSYYPDSGIWEPIFYSKNDAATNTYTYNLLFTQATKAKWPPIVQQRFEEFKTMCKSSGLGIYTDFHDVNNKVLLPLSIAVSLGTVYGILRDVYNHVSSVVYTVDGKHIVVPVIDDGTLYPGTRIELDWRNIMFSLAPANRVREFYESVVQKHPAISSVPVRSEFYSLGPLIRLNRTVPARKDIYAFELRGGLFIPVKKSEEEEDEQEETEYRGPEGIEPTWMLDTKLVFGKEEGIVNDIDRKDFEEIYQHLRLTFSNWLVMNEEVRDSVQSILFKDGHFNLDLPLYEKRQRLLILFGNDVLSWLDSSLPQRDRKPSIKRIDCRLSGEDTCSNRCVWKEETESCLLHVPGRLDIGGKQVDARRILVRKLIDELIRFPEKRSEILKQQVSKFQVLRDGFRSGNEYIVPENTIAWTDLLRMEWRKKEEIKGPRYVEEYMAMQPEAADEFAEEVPAAAVPMPEVLQSLLGKQAAKLHFIPNDGVYSVLSDTFGMDIDLYAEATEVDTSSEVIFTDKEHIEIAAGEIKASIVQLAYEPENPIAPEPLIAKGAFANKKLANVLFFVQLPDGTTGTLSTSPDEVTIISIQLLPGPVKLAFLQSRSTLIV